jgi:peroxiredoxin
LSYLDRLKQIQAQFQNQGFTLVGINANDVQQDSEESFKTMKQFAIERQLNFPYLWDSTQDVAHSFGAERTPEAFVIDREGILRYNGRIDDNPQEASAVTVPYLQNAIAALLSGQEVHPDATKAIGCTIKWRNELKMGNG